MSSSTTSPTFKQMPQSGDHNQQGEGIPIEERHSTNTLFLALFAICFLLLIPVSVILSWSGNLSLFFYGHDKFGNICGVKNKPIIGINCSGIDMTDKPYAQMTYVPMAGCFLSGKKKLLSYKCVDNCNPPSQLIFHRCYPSEEMQTDRKSKYSKQVFQIMHSISEFYVTISVMALTGFILSFGIFACLNCNVIVTFWNLVTFQLVLSVVAVTFFTHKYMTEHEYSILHLFFAIGSMSYFIFLVLFIFFLRNTFGFLCRLYQKTISAIFKTPMVLIQPLMAILAQVVLVVILTVAIVLVLTNGCLKPLTYYPATYEYVTNTYAILYALYLFFLMFWSFSFICGTQAMVVAYSLGRHYFSRKNPVVESAVGKGVTTVTRYHLGTVSLGSLMTTIFWFIGNLMEYVLRKIYIETGLFSQGFWKASLHIIELLGVNLIHTAAVTGFTYIIVCGYSLFVIMLTTGVGIWMNLDYFQQTSFSYYAQLSILIGAVTASIVSFFVMGVLTVATDTIFLCLCQEHLNRKNESNMTYLHPELINDEQPESHNKRLKRSKY